MMPSHGAVVVMHWGSACKALFFLLAQWFSNRSLFPPQKVVLCLDVNCFPYGEWEACQMGRGWDLGYFTELVIVWFQIEAAYLCSAVPCPWAYWVSPPSLTLPSEGTDGGTLLLIYSHGESLDVAESKCHQLSEIVLLSLLLTHSPPTPPPPVSR